MPLNGGALTLRWMHAPARGLTVAPVHRWSPPLSLARVEKTEALERRMN
jgi:hypothetical protein